MTLMLFAGTVGALTVIYEFARGMLVFVDPTRYLWNASSVAFSGREASLAALLARRPS